MPTAPPRYAPRTPGSSPPGPHSGSHSEPDRHPDAANSARGCRRRPAPGCRNPSRASLAGPQGNLDDDLLDPVAILELDPNDPPQGSGAGLSGSAGASRPFLGPAPPDAHMGNARASRPGDGKHRERPQVKSERRPLRGRRDNYSESGSGMWWPRASRPHSPPTTRVDPSSDHAAQRAKRMYLMIARSDTRMIARPLYRGGSRTPTAA